MRGDAYSHWCAFSMATEMPQEDAGDPRTRRPRCHWPVRIVEWVRLRVVRLHIVSSSTCLTATGRVTTAPQSQGDCPTRGTPCPGPRECAALIAATTREWCRGGRRVVSAGALSRNGYSSAGAYETAATRCSCRRLRTTRSRPAEYGAIRCTATRTGVAARSAVPAGRSEERRELELGSGTRASTTVRSHTRAPHVGSCTITR